jgi:hypothetical protein
MRTQTNVRFMLGLGLCLLMALTRSGLFGSHANASWAVFFLGGAFLHGMSAFAALCGLAGAIDLIVLFRDGSAPCMSPAYVFLLPAYGLLWWAGRCAGFLQRSQLLRVPLAILLGTTGAFVITSGSYFALSKHHATTSLESFAVQVAPELPQYLLTSVLYVSAGYALAAALRAARLAAARRPHDAR